MGHVATAEWLARLRMLNLRAPAEWESWSPLDVAEKLLGRQRSDLILVRSGSDGVSQWAAVTLSAGSGTDDSIPYFPPCSHVRRFSFPLSVRSVDCGSCGHFLVGPGQFPLLPPLDEGHTSGAGDHGHDHAACGCPMFDFEHDIESSLIGNPGVLHWSADRLGLLACLADGPQARDGPVCCRGCGARVGTTLAAMPAPEHDNNNEERGLSEPRVWHLLSSLNVVVRTGPEDDVCGDPERRLGGWLAWLASSSSLSTESGAEARRAVQLPSMRVRLLNWPVHAAEWTREHAWGDGELGLRPAVSVLVDDKVAADNDELDMTQESTTAVKQRLLERGTRGPSNSVFTFIFS